MIGFYYRSFNYEISIIQLLKHQLDLSWLLFWLATRQLAKQ